MPYLTTQDVFGDNPFMYPDPMGAEYFLVGCIDARAAALLLTPAPGAVPAEVDASTLENLWVRFARHDPRLSCDDGFCDCAEDYSEYPWWEICAPGAEGAIEVTSVCARINWPAV
jgi:hypothetical protein